MLLQPTGPTFNLSHGVVWLALLGSLGVHAGLLSIGLSRADPGGPAQASRSLSLQVVRTPSVAQTVPTAESSQPREVAFRTETTAAEPEPQPAKKTESQQPLQKQLAVSQGPALKTRPTPSAKKPITRKKGLVAQERGENPKTTPTKASAVQAPIRPAEQIKRLATESLASKRSESNPAASAAKSMATARPQQPDDGPRQLVSLLQGSLARHFRYPSMARRRGYQGTVTLRLRVQSDGLIEQVQLVKGSGFGILDRDAIKTLRRIGRVPLQHMLLSEAVELTLPVVYRLTSG